MKVPVRFSSVIAQLPLRHCLFPNIYICLFFVCTLCLYSIPAVAQNAIVLVGSGSSVPAPLFSRWTQEYGKRNPNIQMRYLPVGTSEGIKQISHGAGDFGAGEAQLDGEGAERGRFNRTASGAHRNRSHLQPSRRPPGAAPFGGSVGWEIFLGDSEDVECAADREAQSGDHFAESSDPGDQPSCRQRLQLRASLIFSPR